MRIGVRKIPHTADLDLEQANISDDPAKLVNKFSTEKSMGQVPKLKLLHIKT